MNNAQRRAETYRAMVERLEAEERFADWTKPGAGPTGAGPSRDPAQPTAVPLATPDISIGDMLRHLWAARRAIGIGMAIGLSAALGYLALAVPSYRAQIVLGPANPLTGIETAAPAGNDNLFALRFVMERMGNAGASDYLNFEQILTGPRVANALLSDPEIRKGLTQDKTLWILPSGRFENAAAFAEYLQHRLRFEPVGATALRRVVYLHPDPAFAALFVQKATHIADGLIRTAVAAQTAERVTYLQTALDQTFNPDNRRALTDLLMEQERLRMLSAIDQPYAANVVEPAAVSARPRWPDWPMIMAVAMAVGACAGFVLHGLRSRRG